MSIPAIRHGVFFSPVNELPRGRHALDREQVERVQRERLMVAFTELVAARGLTAVAVADVVARAGVSRGVFYACFADLAACADAGYERFIEVIVGRLSDAMDPSLYWGEFLASVVRAYLETLQADTVVARAFLIEMDAAGRSARLRRYRALKAIADLFAARYAQLRDEDPTIGPLPEEAHLGMVHAVRQLACDQLDHETDPDLLRIVDPVVRWMSASVAGAATLSDAEGH